MKRIIIIIIFVISFFECEAQKYNADNSFNRIALVYYYQDEKGFYNKKENINLEEVSSIVSSYGYDKKSQELYIETDRANCVVTVNKDLHKILKNSKSIPQLKKEELSSKSRAINEKLERKFKMLNRNLKQHIEDSLQKVREDSIRKASELRLKQMDSLRIAKKSLYRSSNKWYRVPTGSKKLYCDFCKDYISEDTIFIKAIKNDTIYWFDLKWGFLTKYYRHVHAAKIPSQIYDYADFKYHIYAFEDSIKSNSEDFNFSIAEIYNSTKFLEYVEDLKKEAPNGFFIEWGWDSEYSNISFNFKYMNTNKNAIKYIEVFFAVTNDVGDLRKTGSFKGTGPVEQFESASWNWDNSSYYVAGDASKMSLTKVIITYMNGKKVVIPKNKIRYN